MKYLIKIAGIAAIVLAPSAVMAVENCATSPVFFCEIQKTGKIVRVCESNGKVNYTFGLPGKEPELELSVKRSAAKITPWIGMGYTYWSSMEIPNGQWAYQLDVSYERGDPDAESLGSVKVLRNGKEIKKFECIGSTVKERIESLVD